jgi:hypothetical protein
MKQRKYVLPELPSVNRVNALYGLRITNQLCIYTSGAFAIDSSTPTLRINLNERIISFHGHV